jgi:hypothetical protein
MLEANINLPEATASDVKDLLVKMRDIIKTEERLCKRFASLQRGYLHPIEIDEINMARTHKMVDTYNRLRKVAAR